MFPKIGRFAILQKTWGNSRAIIRMIRYATNSNNAENPLQVTTAL